MTVHEKEIKRDEIDYKLERLALNCPLNNEKAVSKKDIWVRFRGLAHEGMPPAHCPIKIEKNGVIKVVFGMVYIGTPDGKIIGEYNEDTQKLRLFDSDKEETIEASEP